MFPKNITGTIGATGPTGFSIPKRYGIIGDGQLGKLLIQESPNTPKFKHCSTYSGDLHDVEAIVNFGRQCDVITIEIENISIQALKTLKRQGKTIIPDPDILEMIQNKLTQKQFLITNNFPTSKLLGSYNQPEEWLAQAGDLREEHLSEVHKLQVGGYDGRGVKIIDYHNHNSQQYLREMFISPSLVEEYVKIDQEISIIIGRNQRGHIIHFEPSLLLPDPETQMLDTLICPAPDLSPSQITEINQLAIKLAETLNLVGLLAIELFLAEDGRILINEMSPRPHNSGHHTIERYNMSQNEVLRRIMTEQPFDNLQVNGADLPYSNDFTTIMTNIIGKENESDPSWRTTEFHSPEYQVHYYHKYPNRPGRKMGHVTHHFPNHNQSIPHQELLDRATRMKYSVQLGQENKTHLTRITNSSNPSVAIIMGSSSDLPVVKDAITILNDFQIPYHLEVVSAHRTPANMISFAQQAQSQGYKVIIAAAGGAAHLPGMVASATTLPVIGIPVKSSNSIQGVDSLLSINQMPSGIPVGTMAINGAKNAGLYAVRILATFDAQLANLLEIYSARLREKVNFQNQECPDYI